MKTIPEGNIKRKKHLTTCESMQQDGKSKVTAEIKK